MQVRSLSLPDVKLVSPRWFEDARGVVFESYRLERYRAAGIGCDFVQDNVSSSGRGVLRGLHYQAGPGQAKLVTSLSGAIFDVAVDLRPDSPTFGRWTSAVLDTERREQLFVPAGFAHGFCVLGERADVLYKLSRYYDPQAERSLRWNDPDLAIDWPVKAPSLSERDRGAESFADFRRRAGA